MNRGYTYNDLKLSPVASVHGWDYKPGSWLDTSASTFRLATVFIFKALFRSVMLASLFSSHHSSFNPYDANLSSLSPFLRSLRFGRVAFRTRLGFVDRRPL